MCRNSGSKFSISRLYILEQGTIHIVEQITVRIFDSKWNTCDVNMSNTEKFIMFAVDLVCLVKS